MYTILLNFFSECDQDILSYAHYLLLVVELHTN